MDDHFVNHLFPQGLKADYNPNRCIHCGEVSAPVIAMPVMTASSRVLSSSGNTTKYEYSHFIPLVMSVCEKCLRSAAKDAMESSRTMPAWFLGGLVLMVILGFVMRNDSTWVGCTTIAGLICLVGIPISLVNRYKIRDIKPESDPLESLLFLVGKEMDNKMEHFKDDLQKATNEARHGAPIVYWALDKWNENNKAKSNG